jgi:hypothetical protein
MGCSVPGASEQAMIKNCRPERERKRFRRAGYLCLLVLVIVGCLAATSWAGEGSHLLDGKSYVGKNGEKGKTLAEYENEEIIFHDGLFTSVSCEPYNFGSSPYIAKVVGDKIHFEAITQSPTHGQIAWRGVIDGDRADVTFVWTKERWFWDIHREYWFKGVLKK